MKIEEQCKERTCTKQRKCQSTIISVIIKYNNMIIQYYNNCDIIDRCIKYWDDNYGWNKIIIIMTTLIIIMTTFIIIMTTFIIIMTVE